MARIAGAVAPGLAHHIIQRGNRRQKTFFRKADYDLYLELMAQWCEQCGVAIWAYCLMPNHVHLIAVPTDEDGLRRALGEAHRRYTRHLNLRKGWRGCLWQGRFASFIMDKPHTLRAARYVELNPVRARLAQTPADYRYSSAAAHLCGRDDKLVSVKPLLKLAGDWDAFLADGLTADEMEALRRHERSGRPLGSLAFVRKLEKRLGRYLHPRKSGRPRKEN